MLPITKKLPKQYMEPKITKEQKEANKAKLRAQSEKIREMLNKMKEIQKISAVEGKQQKRKNKTFFKAKNIIMYFKA